MVAISIMISSIAALSELEMYRIDTTWDTAMEE
jgi:hypothetical protein